MFERFTDRAWRVLDLAQDEARRQNHNYIGTEHLLLGLIGECEGVSAKALRIGLTAVRQEVENLLGPGLNSASGTSRLRPGRITCCTIQRESGALGHNYIGTEDILLGMLREGDGVAVQVLLKLGADVK